ncbi:helix-turn-helix transcriptional regulator [Microlunatus sp. Y2014]|uniref:helix-turn-helix transcriptional regulator n=1 Tax=Microlunatus sp. Y2014 TaxID=3418488 RepID=UPI003DA6D276
MSEEKFDVVVGRTVAKLRKAAGMTQAELAEAVYTHLGFRQQTIVKIENGSRPLRLEEAESIAFALRVEIKDLLAFDDPVRVDGLTLLHRRVHLVWQAQAEVINALVRFWELLSWLEDALAATDGDSMIQREARGMLQQMTTDHVVKAAEAAEAALPAAQKAEIAAGVAIGGRSDDGEHQEEA